MLPGSPPSVWILLVWILTTPLWALNQWPSGATLIMRWAPHCQGFYEEMKKTWVAPQIWRLSLVQKTGEREREREQDDGKEDGEKEREREREKERWREVGIKGEGSQIKMIQNALTFCSFIVSMSNIWHANWTLAISLILWMCSISSWRLLDHAPPSRDEEEILQSWKWGLDPSGAVG